jgi:hypothetical protein
MTTEEYEQVENIVKNDHTYYVGDKLACTCEYVVEKLYPVWHADTKKHWIDHPNNNFLYRHIIAPLCLVHGSCQNL